MKHLLFAGLLAFAATPALAMDIAGQHSSCMIWAQEASAAAKADRRLSGADEAQVVKALDAFARGQRAAFDQGRDEQIAFAKALGFTEAEVDAENAADMDAARKAFARPGPLHAAHLITLAQCAQRTKDKAHLGQSEAELGAALDVAYGAVS